MTNSQEPLLTGKVQTLGAIDLLLEREREAGRTIALCHGVFDLLHPGHFRHLQSASNLADVLVVTITGDRYVGKGPGRPVFSQDLRAEALAGIAVVDYVVIIEDATAFPAISAVHPNIYVKGQEYSQETDDPTGNIRRERELVENLGGSIGYTNDIDFSSSKLINSFLPQHSETTQKWLTDLKSQHDVNEVFSWLDRIADLRVTIVGEVILDVYTNCEALGKASKEPVLCLNRGDSVTHGGGVLAIAGHCAGLGASVTVVSGMNSADFKTEQIENIRRLGVDTKLVPLDPRPTIRKERLVDNQTQARVLEIYQMDDSPLDETMESALTLQIRAAADNADVLLIADYGHGLLGDRTIREIGMTRAFLAVNAQTNAGNHGYNSLGKYPRANFATLNGKEARLEVRRRHLDLDAYMPELCETLEAGSLLVTQGGSGIDLYLSDGTIEHGPALAPFVKDRVGAGDAVLSATSLLSALGAPAPIVAFIGNMVGAWAVSFLGNERTLNIGDLKRQISATLK